MNRLTLPLADWVGAASKASLSDGQLLHRFVKAGEQHAFAMLVKRHGPMVWGVTRRLLRTHQDAEDAFQATFLVLSRKAPSLRQPHLLANWLHGVAHRTALQMRSRQKTAVPLEAAQEPFNEHADPLAWRECGAVIDWSIEQLPSRLRIVFLLCHAEGLTAQAAGKRLSLPEGTVESRLHRARRQLQGLLARHGITSAAGAVVATWSVALPESVSAIALRSIMTSTPPALIAGLAQGVLTTMMWIKISTAAVVVSTLGIVGVGAATLARPGSVAKTTSPEALVLPVQQKGDAKDERIMRLMMELEAARLQAQQAMDMERQLRDQLETEKKRGDAVKKFLQNDLLSERNQAAQAAASRAEAEARLREAEMQARRAAEKQREEHVNQVKRKQEQLQNAREHLSVEIEKLQKEHEQLEAKQLSTLAQQQELERRLEFVRRELEAEMRVAEKQFGVKSQKMKELKDKHEALAEQAVKQKMLSGAANSASSSMIRLSSQIKLREKLLLEVEEKLLRLQLRLDD